MVTYQKKKKTLVIMGKEKEKILSSKELSSAVK